MEKGNADLTSRITQLKRYLEIKLHENTELNQSLSAKTELQGKTEEELLHLKQELETLHQNQPLYRVYEPSPQEQQPNASDMNVRQGVFPIQKANNCCYCSCQEGQ